MVERAISPEQRFVYEVFGDDFSEETLSASFRPGNEPILKELRQHIAATMCGISYRERGILQMRFGLGDGHAYTLAQAGYVFKLTRERIRQIQVKAMRKVRARGERLRKFLQDL